jgi:hypothetical protein
MLNIIIEAAQLVLICYVLVDMAAFIAELIYPLGKAIKNKLGAIIFNLFIYILSCDKCFSFWLTLIFTHNLFIACVIALITNLLKSLTYKFNKTEL